MSLHNRYMIVIFVLFAAVFAIMIASLIRHRRRYLGSSARLCGTRGAVQWFWALLPLAILAGINVALILPAQDHLITPPQKIKLGTAPGAPDALPTMYAEHLVKGRSDARARS